MNEDRRLPAPPRPLGAVGPTGGTASLPGMDAPIDRLLASAGGSGAMWPAAYDLGWTAIIAIGALAAVWMLVSVVRSALSGSAKALWIVLWALVAPVAIVAWLVIGRDARASGREIRASRAGREPSADAS